MKVCKEGLRIVIFIKKKVYVHVFFLLFDKMLSKINKAPVKKI